MIWKILCVLCLYSLPLTCSSPTVLKLPGSLKSLLVAGHRGGMPNFYENSVEAAVEAIRAGMPAVEADVVLSSDGILFVQHDLSLSRTTDIESRREFSSRRRPSPFGDQDSTGEKGDKGESSDFWAFDFNSTELASLHHKCQSCSLLSSSSIRRPPLLSTLRDYLSAVQAEKASSKNNAILLLELKGANKMDILRKKKGVPLVRMEDAVLAELSAAGFRKGEVYLMAFEPPTLRYIRSIYSSPLAKTASMYSSLTGSPPTTSPPSVSNAPSPPPTPAFLSVLSSSIVQFIKSHLQRPPEYPLVQLIAGPSHRVRGESGVLYGDLVTKLGIDTISEYANAVGPYHGYITGEEVPQILGISWVAYAHSKGLEVYAWTFKRDVDKLRAAFQHGVDAVICDDVTFGMGAAATYMSEKSSPRLGQAPVIVDHKSLAKYEKEKKKSEKREQVVRTVSKLKEVNPISVKHALFATGVMCLALGGWIAWKAFRPLPTSSRTGFLR